MHKTNSYLRFRLLREGQSGEPSGGGGGATPPANDGLSDAGRVAIERERENAATARQEKAAAVQERDRLQQELDALKGTTQEQLQQRAIEAARAEARAQVLGEVGQTLIASAIEAAATSAKFFDPADAAALLSGRVGEVTVSEQGLVDKAKVAELVKALAESKPHLVQSGAGATPLPGQGTPPAAPNTGSVAAGAALYAQHKQKT